MKLIRFITYYLLGIISIIFVSVFVQYFSGIAIPNTPGYLEQLYTFVVELFKAESWIYIEDGSASGAPMMEVMWPAFIYSTQILVGALFLGFGVAFFFALGATFLPKLVLRPIRRILDLLESIPDMIMATLLQIMVIIVFKATGFTLFEVASYKEKAYFGPILTLSILPAVSMFKIVLLMIEEEFLKVYVTFAKSKGISKFNILIKHIIKNIMPISFHHMKIIIWSALSSQFIIERIFNVHGLTYFLLEGFKPMTIFVTLSLIFTPFYFFFQIVDLWLKEEQMLSYEKKSKSWHFRDLGPGLMITAANLVFMLKSINLRRLLPTRPILSILFGFWRHFKNWKFTLGMLFFIITIGYSIFYSVTTNNHVDQVRLYYAEDGVTLISAMHHSPPKPFLFGSDKLGFSLFDKLVIGAKYTLIYGLLIAFLRVLGGLVFGVIYAFHLGTRTKNWLGKLIDSIHFLPLTLVAYILLEPILMPVLVGYDYIFTFSSTERILLEIVILTILVLPLTTVLLGKEITRVMDYEFIASAKVLGGSRFHIFWRHVMPHIGPRLSVLIGQQFIQTLLVFIHLGIFQFFFGGTLRVFGVPSDPPMSLTHEWSGLIGDVGRTTIASGRYWYLWILVAFMLAIFAMQLIIQGVKEVQQVKVGVLYKVPKVLSKNAASKTKEAKSHTISKQSFQGIERST